jgi:hypothetical protein
MRLLRSSHGVAAAAVALAVLGITMIALGECRSAVNSPRMRCAWVGARARWRGAARRGDGPIEPGSPPGRVHAAGFSGTSRDELTQLATQQKQQLAAQQQQRRFSVYQVRPHRCPRHGDDARSRSRGKM